MQKKTTDRFSRNSLFILSVLVSALVLVIGVGLFLKSRFILGQISFKELFFSIKWQPQAGHFGFKPFILGTIWVTIVAVVLAVPASIFTAIYLSEYAPLRFRNSLKPVLDLLAGISPVIFGVFGVLAIVPFIGTYVLPFADKFLRNIPLFNTSNFTGFGILASGIVLAMMIFPVITQVAEEVIRSTPQEMRDSLLALGATKWEVVKCIIFKKAGAGIIAAIILGLSRAFGETIAVLMVVGNVVQVPKSILDAGYTLPALIANNYGEMMSIPLYDSALMLAAFILLLVTVVFNILAWGILLRIERQYV